MLLWGLLLVSHITSQEFQHIHFEHIHALELYHSTIKIVVL